MAEASQDQVFTFYAQSRGHQGTPAARQEGSKLKTTGKSVNQGTKGDLSFYHFRIRGWFTQKISMAVPSGVTLAAFYT
jgi:hypothetical protein